MSDAEPTRVSWGRRGGVLLEAGLLLALVFLNGTPGLDSPWLLGDEFIFLADNPQVTDTQAPLSTRLAELYSSRQQDLYQPTLIAWLAVLWRLFGDSPFWFRAADLALHGLNTVLLWLLLRRLLGLWLAQRAYVPAADEDARLRPAPLPAGLDLLLWMIALFWAVHPALIGAYAGDLCTPHLLAPALAMPALFLHLRSLRSGGAPYFVASLALLFLASACKVLPGYFGLVLLLEAALLGWRGALRAPRIWLVGGLTIAFIIAAAWTTRTSGLLEDVSANLFGDPLSRGMLALWFALRNAVAPLWLAAWYPPDPGTGWRHPLVWAGAAITLLLMLVAGWALRRGWRSGAPSGNLPRWGLVALAWFVAGLYPLLGFFGARLGIFFDRYLYQPLMAAALLAGLLAGYGVLRAHGRMTPPLRAFAVLLLAGSAWNMYLNLAPAELSGGSPVRAFRDPILRVQRVVAMHPRDPRGLEMLAATYDFARNHPLTEYGRRLAISDEPGDAAADRQYQYFNRLFVETLQRAAEADLDRYFPALNRAGFHRRLATWFIAQQDAAAAMKHAQAALQLDPAASNTWLVLARVYRLQGRWAEAQAAYEQREQRLPATALARAVHFIEHGDLLLKYLNQPVAAKSRYEAALQAAGAAEGAGAADLATRAVIGLALSEIRGGEGARGRDAVQTVLRREPHNREARLVLAEYHLRSHHWDEARAAYVALLESAPTQIEALLGLHEVANQTGAWAAALAAWDRAFRLEPANRTLRSFYAWAAACAGLPTAAEVATALLEIDPQNPLGALALMLHHARAGRIDEALAALQRAQAALSAGQFVPFARPLDRAYATVRVLRGRDALPPDSAIVEAALAAARGDAAGARDGLETFLRENPGSAWRGAAEALLRDAPK